MRYRRTDANGDYVFGQGKYNYLIGTDAVAQAIMTKIKLLKGEWWEDIEDGTPLFQEILSQKATEQGVNAIDIIVKSRILEVDDVNNIISFDSRIENRKYIANLNIETNFGTIEDLQINL